MDDAEFKSLIEAFKAKRTTEIDEEDVMDEPFTADQLNVLIQAIKENEDVTFIDLNNQNLTSEQAVKLADAITGKVKLTYLDVGRNHIGDDGAIALATAIKTTTALVGLKMYSNGIDEAGIIALAEAIQDHPSLNTAELDHNNINSKNAITALVNMIDGNFKAHKKLLHISLIDCGISLEAAMPLINMVDQWLKDGKSPSTMPYIGISKEANAKMAKLIEYMGVVAGPLFAFKAAGLKSQEKTPAKEFLRRDGNEANARKIAEFLGSESPKKTQPPTQNN